ncbi:hypothetical protein KP509_02G083600 [Ceratopteris richardii]|uniref:Peptidase A1 domain-containing protein n=1 Tax=Ceratopteris richardii TaxID=49495 RepID=A0A8T2VG38_CERRI|nr:hypothetical protein KP509_02G083600 [Ceratopteris richardii]
MEDRHASLSSFFLLALLSFILSYSCSTAYSNTALVAPISYDPSTSLYSVSPLGGPPFDRPLLLNLDSSNLWRDCMHPLLRSPPLEPVLYDSAICKSAKVQSALISGDPGYISGCSGAPTPVCSNFSCSVYASASLRTSPSAVLWTDTISLLSINGSDPGKLIRVPKFAFACSDDILLNSDAAIPANAVGAAGLSRALLALPKQLAAKLRMPRRFAYCLPLSVVAGRGALFFGQTSYIFPPGGDLCNRFQYTPLLNNPQEPDSYFIGVESIFVNKVKLPINASLLQLREDPNIIFNNKMGIVGGTSISSTLRYTRLESSIYDALASEFSSSAAAMGIQAVGAAGAFETCFNTSTVAVGKGGFGLPVIAFSLQGSNGPIWEITNDNTVDFVGKFICLAFQRADQFQPRSIVLGTYQQQDCLLQFDLDASKFGVVPNLSSSWSRCTNFRFGSTA